MNLPIHLGDDQRLLGAVDDTIELLGIQDDDPRAVPQQCSATGMLELIDSMDHRQPAFAHPYRRRSGADLDEAPVDGRQSQAMAFHDRAKTLDGGLHGIQRHVANRDTFP